MRLSMYNKLELEDLIKSSQKRKKHYKRKWWANTYAITTYICLGGAVAFLIGYNYSYNINVKSSKKNLKNIVYNIVPKSTIKNYYKSLLSEDQKNLQEQYKDKIANLSTAEKNKLREQYKDEIANLSQDEKAELKKLYKQ